MKDWTTKIIVALAIAGIIAGANAVSRVGVLENDMVWIKETLKEIKHYIKDNKKGCSKLQLW